MAIILTKAYDTAYNWPLLININIRVNIRGDLMSTLRSASLPVKLAVMGLAIFCCFAAWVFISPSKEEPGRIDVSPQAAQTNQPDRDNAQPGGRTSGPTRTPDSQPPPSPPHLRMIR